MITTLGVLILTPDTLVIRLIDLPLWDLIFWRSLLEALGLTLILLAVYRRRFFARCQAVGRAGLVLSVLIGLSMLSFIYALDHTTVANTLIIISASPLPAALFSRIFLKERIALRTWRAILGAIAGIAVLAHDSLGQGTLLGDAVALFTSLTVAIELVIMRYARINDMNPALALGHIMLASVLLPVVGLPALPAGDLVIGLLLMGAFVVLASATYLITLGPRYITAPEVGLIMLLETVLGPLWVWLAIGENPGKAAILGGAIVIATLALHELAALKSRRRAAIVSAE